MRLLRRQALMLLAVQILGPALAWGDGSGGAARRRFSGRFRYAGGDLERAARDAAIERSTAEMPFGIRSIARSRLRAKTAIVPWVELEFPPGRIRVTVPGHPAAESPADGEEVAYSASGESLRLAQRWVGDSLVQSFASAQGRRVNSYRLDETGQRITLWVRVTSPRVPTPVEYTLTYRR